MASYDKEVFSFTLLEPQANALEAWLFTVQKLGLMKHLSEIMMMPAKSATYQVQDEYYDVPMPWVRVQVILAYARSEDDKR